MFSTVTHLSFYLLTSGAEGAGVSASLSTLAPRCWFLLVAMVTGVRQYLVVLVASMACRNSWARDQTHTVAATPSHCSDNT